MAMTFAAGVECGTLDEFGFTSGSVSASQTQVHSGNYALRVNPSASTGYARLGTSLKSGSFYMYIASMPAFTYQIFSTYGLNDLNIRLDNSGTLYLYDANTLRDTGSSTLSTGQWYRISYTVASSGYDARVYLNGTEELSYATCTQNGWYGSYGSYDDNATYDIYYDDIVEFDDTGTADPGDYRIADCQPNGEGNHQDTGSSGAKWRDPSDNALTYDHVDTIPFGTGDYGINYAEGNWNRYSVALESCSDIGLSGSDTIEAVKFSWYYKTDGGGGVDEYYTLIRESGGGSPTTTDTSIDDPKAATYLESLHTTPPSGGSWSQSIVDGMEMGMSSDDANKDMWYYGGVASVVYKYVEVAVTSYAPMTLNTGFWGWTEPA